jgi:hypothetical protein
MKPTEAETTRNAILCAFWMKGRKEFVEMTGEEIASRTGQPHTVIAANLGLMHGLVIMRRQTCPKTFVLSKAGERRALELMKPKPAPPKPKPKAKPQPQPPQPVRLIEDETEYAKALAKIAGAENAAAYKAGTIAVHNSPSPRVSELTQLQARVLAAIESEPDGFTVQTIADKIASNRQQVSAAMHDLRIKGRTELKRCRRTNRYSRETSPEGREMPISEISDPPQPKTKVRVVEAKLTPSFSTAQDGQHVNRISLPAETWAAE